MTPTGDDGRSNFAQVALVAHAHVHLLAVSLDVNEENVEEVTVLSQTAFAELESIGDDLTSLVAGAHHVGAILLEMLAEESHKEKTDLLDGLRARLTL